MTQPLRTCLGCGRKAPQAELVRFVARGGRVEPDPERRRSGRGAYTCRSRSCFERAASRRAFSRALRADVAIPAELVLAEG